jgi:Uma2 family endonuclease
VNDPSVVITRRKFSVDDYHRMGEAGILDEDDRVELIDGEIITMAPIGQDHVGIVNRLAEALFHAFAGRAIVSVQNPVRLDDENEPQPDFAVLRRRHDFYTTGEPAGPADVLLLVEVADGSLRFDRAVKLPLYARAGIPEVWIVNLKRRVVEAHRAPRAGAFTETATAQGDGVLIPVLDPEVRITLRQVFG